MSEWRRRKGRVQEECDLHRSACDAQRVLPHESVGPYTECATFGLPHQRWALQTQVRMRLQGRLFVVRWRAMSESTVLLGSQNAIGGTAIAIDS